MGFLFRSGPTLSADAKEDKEPVERQKQKADSDCEAGGAEGGFVFSLAEIRSLLQSWRQDKQVEQLEGIQT